MTSIFIITVNWQTPSITNDFINHLLTINNLDEVKIIVVNNSPEDNLSFISWENNQKVKIINTDENLGYGGGLNCGIEFALEDNELKYVIITNNDVVAPKSLISDFEKYPWENNLLSPVVVYKGTNIVQNTGGRILHFIGGTINLNKNVPIEKLKIKQVDFLSGCMMVISKEIINNVGLFDPDYLAYYEDVDYCIRANTRGYGLIVCEDIQIEHTHSASTKNNSGFKRYLIAKNSIIFAKKNLPNINKQIFILASIVRGFFQNLNFLSSYSRGVIDGLKFKN